MDRTRHAYGLLILIGLIASGSLYLWQNNQPVVTVALPVTSPTPGAAAPADWQVALETQIALAGTLLPTPDLAITAFVPPTLPPQEIVIIEPDEIQVTPWPTSTPRPTNTPAASGGPTPFPSPTGVFAFDDEPVENFQPPPEQVPLSPHANDHFWLMRPVDASANSASLFYYPFGSTGPGNEYRVHHGIDIPNEIGAPIQAGGSGKVVFAGNGGQLVDVPQDIDIYPAYGNVVVIEHDFGFRGQRIYSLYAHMAAIVVSEGQRVAAGDIIGLIGGTGDVSGPHVHLEVRLGENKYFSAYNPLLWVAPYLGHGVVAGRVTGFDGLPVENVTVTLTRRGRIVQTTTTYIDLKEDPNQRNGWHVVSDPGWNENFVMGDVPEGDYEISVSVGGRTLRESITVKAGTTNFVSLDLEIPATPQVVSDDGA